MRRNRGMPPFNLLCCTTITRAANFGPHFRGTWHKAQDIFVLLNRSMWGALNCMANSFLTCKILDVPKSTIYFYPREAPFLQRIFSILQHNPSLPIRSQLSALTSSHTISSRISFINRSLHPWVQQPSISVPDSPLPPCTASLSDFSRRASLFQIVAQFLDEPLRM